MPINYDFIFTREGFADRQNYSLTNGFVRLLTSLVTIPQRYEDNTGQKVTITDSDYQLVEKGLLDLTVPLEAAPVYEWLDLPGTVHVPAHQVLENATYEYTFAAPNEFNDPNGWYNQATKTITLPSGGWYIINWSQMAFYVSVDDFYHYSMALNGILFGEWHQYETYGNKDSWTSLVLQGEFGGSSFVPRAKWERRSGTNPAGSAVVREGSTKGRLSVVRIVL